MISAPVDMRCRSMPKKRIARKVAASTSGMVSATTSPVRMPSVRNETTSTIATASSSEAMNSPTAFFTTAGWSDTCSNSMPSGRPALIRAMPAFRSRPSASTSPLGTIDTASAIASLPPKRIFATGGSA